MRPSLPVKNAGAPFHTALALRLYYPALKPFGSRGARALIAVMTEAARIIFAFTVSTQRCDRCVKKILPKKIAAPRQILSANVAGFGSLTFNPLVASSPQ